MNKQENVPVLRFPEFSGNWVVKKLEEMIEFKAGYAFKSEQMLSVKDNYQILKMSNVYKNELRLDRNPSYWGSINSKEKEFLLQIGDTILTLTGTVGKQDYGYSVQIKESNKYLLNQRLVLLRELQCISNNDFISQLISNEKFLFYFFAESKGGTGNQSNVSIEDVKSIHLSFPTLPEQQKIATFLSSVDEKLQGLKKKKSLLEAYKKGMMQRLFSSETGLTRLEDEQDLDDNNPTILTSRKLRFRQDNGEDFPEWEEKTLGEVATFSKGKGISKADIDDTGITECIRYGELYTYYGETINVIKSKTNISPENLVLSEANDIIIPASGETQIDIATASCVLKSGIALGGDLNIIKTKQNGVFMAYYLNNARKQQIAGLAQGISVVHLYASQLQLLELSLPSLPEQTKISNFLSAIDEKIAKVSQEIEQVTVWKKGLLQQMFV